MSPYSMRYAFRLGAFFEDCLQTLAGKPTERGTVGPVSVPFLGLPRPTWMETPPPKQEDFEASQFGQPVVSNGRTGTGFEGARIDVNSGNFSMPNPSAWYGL